MPFLPFTVNFAWFQTPTFKHYKFFDISNKNNSLAPQGQRLRYPRGRGGCKGEGCATPGAGRLQGQRLRYPRGGEATGAKAVLPPGWERCKDKGCATPGAGRPQGQRLRYPRGGEAAGAKTRLTIYSIVQAPESAHRLTFTAILRGFFQQFNSENRFCLHKRTTYRRGNKIKILSDEAFPWGLAGGGRSGSNLCKRTYLRQKNFTQQQQQQQQQQQ